MGFKREGLIFSNLVGGLGGRGGLEGEGQVGDTLEELRPVVVESDAAAEACSCWVDCDCDFVWAATNAREDCVCACEWVCVCAHIRVFVSTLRSECCRHQKPHVCAVLIARHTHAHTVSNMFRLQATSCHYAHIASECLTFIGVWCGTEDSLVACAIRHSEWESRESKRAAG